MTSLVTINLSEARKLLKEAVETQGRDFVYNTEGRGYCKYVPDAKLGTAQSQPQKALTGCLVGTALKLAGIPEAELDYQGNASRLANFLQDKVVAYIHKDAVSYFLSAQTVQDGGGTWGAALDTAEKMHIEKAQKFF